MSKYLLYMVAGFLLALSSAVMADDADPTLGERVGYALSRARSAAHGDQKALASLRTDAALPDAAAEFGLGEYYYFTKDYPQSVAWLKKSADQGFPGGYYGLGKAYELGRGMPRDYTQAMRMYRQATVLPEAEMRIGDLYAYGWGVQEDDAQTVIWYRKAAEAGSIRAQVLLGAAYEMKFWHLKQDYPQAMQWYLKAAQQGDADGEHFAGALYEQPGALQDYQQAALWLQKASQQGIAEAQLDLGKLYSGGQGVPADTKKAVQQFQMAANQGEPQAMCRLAQSFADGAGVPVDPFRAYQWFALSGMWPFNQAGHTCDVATARMQQLEQKLGPAQTARAERAAYVWRDAHSDSDSKADDLSLF